MLKTLSALLIASAIASAQDIVVPVGGSIQAAIALASNGSRILVPPGTWFERIDFLGKAVEVIGIAGAAQTTLDGTGGAPVVGFFAGEGPASRLQGFTIRGGASSAGAGGIVATGGATPTIEDCIIRQNSGRFGGGVSGSPILRRCSILANTASLTHGGGLYGAPQLSHCVVADNRCTGGARGGGLYVTGGNSTIDDCVFADNAAVFAGSQAGAIGMGAGGSATIRRSVFVGNFATGGVFAGVGGAIFASTGTTIQNCTFVDNVLSGSSTLGGAVYGPATIENCIVRGNTAPQIEGATSVTFSDVEGGYAGAGNFDLGPQFVSTVDRDYHLTGSSPCIDAGNPTGSDPDGSIADVGAFWFRTLYARSNTRAGDGSEPSLPEISSVVGGRLAMRVLAGAANGNAAFLTIGAISGTSPGVSLFGWQIPINVDFYTDLTLTVPNGALLSNSLGTLDADGRAETLFTLPPIPGGLPIPITVHHATLVLGATAPIDFVTNAEPCIVLPR